MKWWILFLMLFVAASTLLVSQQVIACSCCSETGDWFVGSKELDDFWEFPRKESYLDAKVEMMRESDVCPLLESEGEEFSTSVTATALVLSSKKNPKNKITFYFPKTFEYRIVDVEKFTSPQKKRPYEYMPTNYLELLLYGQISLSGDLSKSRKVKGKGTLVYQGSGYFCIEPGLLQSWFLQFKMEDGSLCFLRSSLKKVSAD